jgi:chromosome segregation ATPase
MPGPAKTRVLVWFGIPALVILIAAAGSGLVWEARTILRLQDNIAALSRENGQLLRRVDDLTRAQPAPPSELPATPAAAHAPRPVTDAATVEALSAAEQQVRRLHDSLAQSSAEAAHLQGKVTELESRVESAAEENRRLSAAVEEERKNLADASQALDGLRAQWKAGGARLADLESLNAKLKEEAAAGRQSSAQTQQTLSDLESILHRREMYLSNILRRYKEITEQYRAMSGVRDGRDRAATPLSSAEVSRIQNSIALAEEDLKQISALNVQAERLEKKLPAK